MYPIGIYQNCINQSKSVASQYSAAVSNPIAQNTPSVTSFKATPQAAPQAQPQIPVTNIRTTFANQDEQNKYVQLTSMLEPNEKKNLDLLLRNGILLNGNSNDKSTTLDNLYKIATNERAKGLDTSVVLKETINTIANPFVITQNFGDIPKQYQEQILQNAKANPKTNGDNINAKSIDIPNSSDCVSASIEFNLAKQMPAEFARFAENLTSPKMAVDKTVQLKNLTDNDNDSLYLLNAFEVPYQLSADKKSANLTLAPDKNSYIRAQIQNVDKDKMERSAVDVLMQSTFMNVGSQGTYDALTDLRGNGKFNNSDNTGLIEFEKTFTESVVQDKNKTSVTYQTLDDDAKLTGYTKDFGTIKKNLLDSLAIGENVIIGYTQTDKTGKVIGGHEITIIGAKQDKNGKYTFICNDTDDNNPHPIEYSEDYIIPKIHHAGLPAEVAEKDSKAAA